MATDSKSKTDKKRLRMSSSTSEDNEENATSAELLQRITLIEQQAAKRDARISQLETHLAEANLEIKELKSKTNDLQRSLEYTQKDQEDAFDRIAECEQEQALHDDELIRQEIYSQRRNMIFFKVPESLNEDCTGVIRAVLTNDVKIDQEEVNGFKFCGVHRLGKQSRGRPRPIIARFTSRSDRDKVWKIRRNLKGSIVTIGEDLPKRVQDIRKNISIPSMKKARSMNPRNKASVIGDKLIVNGKQYLHFNIPKRWMNTESPRDSSENQAEDEAEMPIDGPEHHGSE